MHTPIAAGHLLDRLLVVHGALAYLIVGALAFGEAALFVGFVLPGETAVLLGGVLAYEHAVSLPGMIVLVVAAAIVGDSVGYEVGRHFGTRLLNLRLLRSRRQSVDKAQQYLRDKGGRAVFLGRFTAFFRAVMPGLAGVAGMHYRRFLAFNATGGLLWGTGFVLLGYLAGASYRKVEDVVGRASIGVLVVVVVAVIAVHLYRRRAGKRAQAAPPADYPDEAHPDRPGLAPPPRDREQRHRGPGAVRQPPASRPS